MSDSSAPVANMDERSSIVVYTGLHIIEENFYMLMRNIHQVLSRFKVKAIKGPSQPNNTCEIHLRRLGPGANFKAAQDALQLYLKTIKNLRPNFILVKKPEVIDLEEEDDLSVIVLEESKGVTVIDLDCTAERSNDGEINIVNDLQDVRSMCVTKPTKSEVPGRLDLSQDRRDIPVVEILDDDVINLDSTLSSTIISIDDSGIQNLNPNGRTNLTISNVKGTLQNAKKFKETTESFLHSVERETLLNNNSNANSSAVKYHQSTYLDASQISVVDLTLVGATEKGRKSPVKRNSEENNQLKAEERHQAKKQKTWKLSYKRPAHLNSPLTQKNTEQIEIVASSGTSNVYNPNANILEKRTGLRPIVIDGNNIAVGHGKGTFSLKGIRICIDYFLKRGHQNVKAFLPQYRQNRDSFDELKQMQNDNVLIFTPSRKIEGKMVASYDDRYIIQYATEVGGVIVSTDNYRDLLNEDPSWRETINDRLLFFTWVEDFLMFPTDPLGKNGPNLEQFLKFPD